MRKLLLIFLSVFLASTLFAQDTELLQIAEKQPEPEGGMEAFYNYIAQELNYPEQAKEKGIEGKVFVQFVIEKDGSLSNIKIMKGIKECTACDAEVIRIIETFNDPKKNAPKWNPAEQRGNAVRVKMLVPIRFELD